MRDPAACPMNRRSQIRRTNDQIRRNTEIRMTKRLMALPNALGNSGFGFLLSFVIRHSSFSTLFEPGSWAQRASGLWSPELSMPPSSAAHNSFVKSKPQHYVRQTVAQSIPTQQKLADVTIHSPRTRMRGVKALNVEWRPWIADFPQCPALNHYQIIHVGIMEAVAPTRIVRTRQTTTYFLACFGGRGKVLIDGRWRVCSAGSACLLPAHTLNAFHALGGARWQFCWVCYQQSPEQRPIADTASPVIAPFQALPLHCAIEGLMEECGQAAQPMVIHHWVELIH